MQVALLLVDLTLLTGAKEVHFVVETSDSGENEEMGDDYGTESENNSRDDVAAVVKANEQFSRRMYSQLGGQQDNLVISPSSISTVLTMLATGAHGKALNQLQQGLSLPMKGIHLLLLSYFWRMLIHINVCFAGDTSRV